MPIPRGIRSACVDDSMATVDDSMATSASTASWRADTAAHRSHIASLSLRLLSRLATVVNDRITTMTASD